MRTSRLDLGAHCVVFTVTFCLFVAPLLADDLQQAITVDEVDRLLVPICVPNATDGRFGSSWQCEMWVRNSADVPVVFARGTPFSQVVPGGEVKIDPRTTIFAAAAPKGAIYVVERAHADQVHISVRIADVNHRPVSHGAEIPVVKERDWLTTAAELLDVSTHPTVRQTLRVYDPDATQERSVRVTVHPLWEVITLAETTLDLRGGSQRSPSFPWYDFPDYAEIPDLVTAFPQIAPHERVRVRIEPLTEGMRFWGFVSITDNATQEVTVIAPR